MWKNESFPVDISIDISLIMSHKLQRSNVPAVIDWWTLPDPVFSQP